MQDTRGSWIPGRRESWDHCLGFPWLGGNRAGRMASLLGAHEVDPVTLRVSFHVQYLLQVGGLRLVSDLGQSVGRAGNN